MSCPPHRRALSKKCCKCHQVGRTKSKPNTTGYQQPKKITPVKYFLLPILIGVAVIAIFYGFEILTQVEIEPAALYVFDVRGGPSVSNYTILFALEDQNGNVGPANGYVSLKIFNSNNTLLYTSYFRVRSGEFLYRSDPVHGNKVLSYSWAISSSDVTPVLISDNNSGHAELTFLSMAGHYATGSYQGLELPHNTQ
jgi:hypothetical protein